ncbi:hypothetical protein B2G71_13725 [Novosphingobium sp. PC22D]|uniref:hypothetical protein n=1 Tax=Novosphingobium sp. PC22D TaxID=1962403 RepID=UPI000BEFA12D|nr:hypothetical protein [Novosphingobium sp. PC22D]PEQ12188.1 hypothetical protein B2G71_13725 [Novosphingobium sp. PC22D]
MLEILAAGLFLLSSGAAEATDTAAPATEEPAKPTGDDRIKCKRLSVTGSLTKKEKVCKTIAEWRGMRERNSEYARDLVDYTRGRPAGN